MSKVNPNLLDNLTSEEFNLLKKYKSDSTIKSLLREYDKLDEDMIKFNENGEYSKLEKCDKEQGGIGRKIAKRLSELTSGSSGALKKGSKRRSSKRRGSKRRVSKRRGSKRRVSKRRGSKRRGSKKRVSKKRSRRTKGR